MGWPRSPQCLALCLCRAHWSMNTVKGIHTEVHNCTTFLLFQSAQMEVQICLYKLYKWALLVSNLLKHNSKSVVVKDHAKEDNLQTFWFFPYAWKNIKIALVNYLKRSKRPNIQKCKSLILLKNQHVFLPSCQATGTDASPSWLDKPNNRNCLFIFSMPSIRLHKLPLLV